MRKGLLFSMTRAAAFVSVAWMSLLGTTGVGQAGAAPRMEPQLDGDRPGEPQDPPPTPSGRSNGLLSAVWKRAWGLPFVPGRSSMMLWKEKEPGVWLVLVGDGETLVTAGVFLETERRHLDHLRWSQDQLDAAGVLDARHYFIAGTLLGSAGTWAAAVYMSAEITHPRRNGNGDRVVRILTPVAPAPNLGAAARIVNELADLPGAEAIGDGNAAAPPDSSESGGGGSDDSVCDRVHDLCVDSCLSKRDARNILCTGGAILCIGTCAFGCAGSVLGYPLCLAICYGGCMTMELACLASSEFEFRACLTDCLIEFVLCASK